MSTSLSEAATRLPPVSTPGVPSDHASGVRQIVWLIVRRALLALVSLVGALLVIFVIVRLAPGDPASNFLGPLATDQQKQALRTALGLDQPWIVQFGSWLFGLLRGDLGMSFSQNLPVSGLLAGAWKTTAQLTGLAALLAIAIGLILGNLSARGRSWSRRSSDVTEAAFLSAPEYSVALILLIGLCVAIPLFPAGGLPSRADAGTAFNHLLLPALALSLPSGAMIGRSLKTAFADPRTTELHESLLARGLGSRRALLHVHRFAMPTTITVIGLQIGAMLGSAVFIEAVFSLQGLGSLALQAIQPRDYPLLQGVILVIAVTFVIVMFVADVLSALTDPRIRKGGVR